MELDVFKVLLGRKRERKNRSLFTDMAMPRQLENKQMDVGEISQEKCYSVIKIPFFMHESSR